VIEAIRDHPRQTDPHPAHTGGALPRGKQAVPQDLAKGLGLLGLAAKERRDVQIVRGNFVANVADVLLHLMDDVGQSLLLRYGFFDFAAGFLCLGKEGWLLLDGFLVGFLETRGDDCDFYGVFHGVVHDGAEDDVGVFVRGFLDDGRSFVNFVQC
jgi:hypothetical protein